MPLAYALCKGKTTGTYRTIFEQMKAIRPGLNPTQITMDFELAAINAAKMVFPTARVQTCYFHFTQSIIRNMGQHGLKTKYQSDNTFAQEIRQLIALAFLPPAQVADAFDELIEQSKTLSPAKQLQDQNLKTFIRDYFENVYIGKPARVSKTGKKKSGSGRGSPRFNISMWNVYESTKKGKQSSIFSNHYFN